MIKYFAKIKEKNNPSILEPSWIGEVNSKQQLVDFWGLKQDDIEWYKLYQNEDGVVTEIT